LSQLVLDCSVAISWSFLDENNAYADLVLAMISDTTAILPAIFYWEITNTLLVGERRQRISQDDSRAVLMTLWSMPIAMDSLPTDSILARTWELGRQYNLAAYDAAYLELAIRLELSLATIDNRLIKAAIDCGVFLESPNLKN